MSDAPIFRDFTQEEAADMAARAAKLGPVTPINAIPRPGTAEAAIKAASLAAIAAHEEACIAAAAGPRTVGPKAAHNLSDDELATEMVDTIRMGRNGHTYDRQRLRALAGEMKRRGWA